MRAKLRHNRARAARRSRTNASGRGRILNRQQFEELVNHRIDRIVQHDMSQQAVPFPVQFRMKLQRAELTIACQ